MEKTNTRSLTLILAVVMIILHIVTDQDQRIALAMSAETGSLTDWHRMSYMVFHANWIHLLINVYSLLVLSFLCNATLRHFLIATAVSIAIPTAILSDIPMLGISVLNYALTGLLISGSRRWVRLLFINIAFIAATSFMSSIAVVAHAWGFGMAFIIGFITSKRFDE